MHLSSSCTRESSRQLIFIFPGWEKKGQVTVMREKKSRKHGFLSRSAAVRRAPSMLDRIVQKKKMSLNPQQNRKLKFCLLKFQRSYSRLIVFEVAADKRLQRSVTRCIERVRRKAISLSSPKFIKFATAAVKKRFIHFLIATRFGYSVSVMACSRKSVGGQKGKKLSLVIIIQLVFSLFLFN